MKHKTFFKTLSLALLAPLCLGALYAEDDAAPEKASAKTSKKAKASKENKASKAGEEDTNYISTSIPGWGNPEAAQRSLYTAIMRGLKGTDPEQVVKFTESPKNRPLVAQYVP